MIKFGNSASAKKVNCILVLRPDRLGKDGNMLAVAQIPGDKMSATNRYEKVTKTAQYNKNWVQAMYL